MAAISKVVSKVRKLLTAAALTFNLSVTPVPASRPRVGRFGVYYTATYARWMKAAKPLAEKHQGEPLTGPLMVMVEQICEKPKTSKREYPRGDVDNHAKGPLDILTKAAKFWQDDDQIVGLCVFKRFAEEGETPRSEVTYVPLSEIT
jgi:Holliday junction resolvase RusA-like endonuclease